MTEGQTPGADNGKERHDINQNDLSSVYAEEVGTFSSLRIRNFRFLISGTVLSNAAQWIQAVTLGWLVYDLTGSGTMLGTINLLRGMASLAMVPIAGLLIDRVNRRRLLLTQNAWLFIITLVMGLILVFGRPHIWYLFVFTFLGGLAQTLDMTLRQVIVFDLVPRARAPNALALISTGWSLMRSFGPGLGGFLILWIGAGGNFLIQASAYVLIAISIVQIRFPPPRPGIVLGSPLQNIREGMRYLAKEKVTRTFMLMGFILPLFIVPTFSVLPPIYAKDVFHGEADILGILVASIGVGGILGGLVTASLGRVERRGLVQLATLFLLSLSLIGFAFCTKLWVALLCMALAGFFELIYLASNQAMLQLSIPDNLRGRVTSVLSLTYVLSPVGGMLAGAGSDLLGGPKYITIILCSIAAVIAVGVFLFSPTVRNYRMSRAIESGRTS
jgi:MFS family permease